MSEMLKKANEYIAEQKGSVNGQFKPLYHFAPSVGWINDPNGLIKLGGKYHLFYQYYPYDCKQGNMYWGHCTSDDLVFFSEQPVALAPDGNEEDGCFSGGAEQDNGKMLITYTRHFEQTEACDQKETVWLAESDDGITFNKKACVFNNDELPQNICRRDFRDPCPVKIDDTFYVFVGAKDTVAHRGAIIVLKGKSLNALQYAFTIGPLNELGDMAECPSYMRIDNKDVIVCSAFHEQSREHDFKSVWNSVFIVGDLDFKSGDMKIDFISETDRGDAFYAPQFVRGEKPTVIAWMENWGKRYPTRDLKHGWVGAFTFPREITLKDGCVYQNPIKALEKFRTPCKNVKHVPKHAEITAEAEQDFLISIHGKYGKVSVGNDGRIFLDTRFSDNQNGRLRHTKLSYGAGTSIRILIDGSCIELFVADGKEAISSRIYLSGEYEMHTEGVKNLKVYEIGRRE